MEQQASTSARTTGTTATPGTTAGTHASAADEAARPLGKRAAKRLAVEADILRVAREHLATDGAAALSLRAVARDLGMVSSGIYRYVDSRDELLTRLIIDSYWSLAAAARSAHDAVPVDDLDARWDALGRAVRGWALERPHDFALIYGSPVPDYEAPAERTEEAGTAVITILVALLDDVRRAGRLVSPDRLGLVRRRADAAVGELLASPLFAETELDAVTLTQGIAAWTLLLGAVTSEVFAQLGPLPDGEALFECLLAVSRRSFITATHNRPARS